MKQHKSTAVTVKLEEGVKSRLQRLGKLKQRSTHWLMKQAIDQYLEHEELDEKNKQDTLKRWEEVEAGLVLENLKVMNWLDSWGTKEEREKP